MGTYLSTPVLDKEEDEGVLLEDEDSPVAYGCVSMQGWRKSMEDAHVLSVDGHNSTYHEDKRVKVFGVFDGHGGSEVAKFCQKYLVDVLMQQTEHWQEGNVGAALVEAFHEIDRMVDDPQRRDELMELKGQMSSFNTGKKTTANNAAAAAASNGIVTASEEDSGDRDNHDDSTPTNTPEDGTTNQSSSSDSTPSGDREPAESPQSSQQIKLSSTDALELFQKLLYMSATGGGGKAAIANSSDEDIVVNVEGQDDDDDEVSSDETNNVAEETAPTPPSANSNRVLTPLTTRPNAGQVCTLPDHPICAGCTSVVAVLIGRTLTVANAGDSRAVLSRSGGVAEALSFDHKPQQQREMDRILGAGGFVNQFGRVNGNLNLSRSIGDLKYKQSKELPPAAQIITAEPDIHTVHLDEDDEFIIIGCDGIWDCLTNEEAVKYVRDRIDEKRPVEILSEMMDHIVSEDPRRTQGIGGDNMTCIIVDLLPSTRSYSNLSSS